jgi:hypothetical protein
VKHIALHGARSLHFCDVLKHEWILPVQTVISTTSSIVTGSVVVAAGAAGAAIYCKRKGVQRLFSAGTVHELQTEQSSWIVEASSDGSFWGQFAVRPGCHFLSYSRACQRV